MILIGFMIVALVAAVDSTPGYTVEANSVTLTCPQKIKWYHGENELSHKHESWTVEAKDGIVKGLYACEYTNSEGTNDFKYFYLNVKVCPNCYDLSGLTATAVILGDLLITAGVILIVYMCVPKHSSSTTAQRERAPNSRSVNPPPPPNPDYERLDHSTLNSGLYAGIK